MNAGLRRGTAIQGRFVVRKFPRLEEFAETPGCPTLKWRERRAPWLAGAEITFDLELHCELRQERVGARVVETDFARAAY